ncbi:MAG: YgfZ/GcvT domain-containing protein, partial [bacterium]
LLSQDLSQLQSNLSMRSFLLAPQGKLRALLWVAGEPERVSLITDAGWGKHVADDLRHYKIRVKATISEPMPVTTVVDAIPGNAIAATLGSRSRAFSSDPLDLPALELAEWEQLRIEAGEPVMGTDVDESTIPQETGLVSEAVSFSKGCFLGQELVARLDNRNGRVNRHLRRVKLDELPALPAAVEDDGGSITSAAGTPDGPTGLGLLHRRINPGDEILVDGIRAVVL